MTIAEKSPALPRRMGWLALWMAMSIATLLGLRLAERTGQQVFCGSAPCPDLLPAALPLYLAFFAIVLPTIPLAMAVRKIESEPAALSLPAIVCAVLLVGDVVLLIAATYDQMWSNYVQPGTLDHPGRAMLLPPEVRAVTLALWPALIGTWLFFVTRALATISVPRSYVVLGVTAGLVTLGAAVAGLITAGSGYAEPIALTATFVWAIWLGQQAIVRRGLSRDSARRMVAR